MFLFILIALPATIVLVQFIGFLVSGKRMLNRFVHGIAELFSLFILPLMYSNFGKANKCCGDQFSTAVFSPDHQLTIAIIILLCLGAYFQSNYRRSIAAPVTEVIINALLLIAIVLNIFIAIHTKDILLALIGNGPIILLFIMTLATNQRLFINELKDKETAYRNDLEKTAWQVLSFPPLLKFPVIFLLCLPLLVILTGILLLFGQKPDSFIRAFTDTYKHGFSQLDYQCENVQCGGHYLCSVAANGHEKVVRPQRLGVRHGHTIICNRQLLIANAFEELIQEKAPRIHKIIRKEYNKVGLVIHRYYSVFNIKLVSDVVYVLMKPLEWIFLLALYSFDKKPENRISRQYLSVADRKMIDREIHI